MGDGNMFVAINKKIDAVLTVATIILMAALVIVVFFQVVNRLYFGLILPWTEELSRFLFVWVSLTATAKCTYNRNHVIVDLIPELWPGRKSSMMLFVSSFFTLVFYLLVTYYGFFWAVGTFGRFPSTMNINIFYINLIVPLSFALMALFHVQYMISDFRELFPSKTNKEAENGGTGE